MHSTRSHGILALSAAALLVTAITAGCGRNAGFADAGSSPAAASMEAPTPTIAGLPSGITEPTAAQTPPQSTQPADASVGAAIPTPDFPAIEALINGVNADLGVDATADTDEGSPQ